MSTKQNEMEMALAGKGCLGRAAADEPVFILRAQDLLAPSAVEGWASRVDQLRGYVTDKTREARALAHQMRAWQEVHTSKVPD